MYIPDIIQKERNSVKNNFPEKTEFLLYQTEDGQIQIETRMQDETVWLSINQMAELFGVDKSGISRHLKNILESGELNRNSVVAIFATTACDGKKTARKTNNRNFFEVVKAGISDKPYFPTCRLKFFRRFPVFPCGLRITPF